jgi:CelD/BcsL family acetyltransferase involved in cellulose biosynthesis
MPVEWFGDPHAFTTADWTGLVEADPEGTIFHSPRFLKPYWEEFGADPPRIVVVTGGSDPEAVAAFEVAHGTLRFLGGVEVTDYMGPVGLPGSKERAAKELMTAVAGLDDWSSADLRGMREDGAWLALLADAAAGAGLEVETRSDGTAPYLPLIESFDAYLAGLGGKQRHEIRRKERRLREALSDVRLVDSTAESITGDLERFVELHRSSVGEKGRFMVPGMELFFRRLADALLADGTFRLAFLEADGELVAGAIGFRDGKELRLYNSAYDRGRGPVAPGMVLVAELIRSAIEEGFEGFDFLKGDLGYKYRFGARPRPVGRLLLRRA